ncbi:hypothetical protein [Agromyces bracchium]|uniref:Uncharacterized protein n=1 Tax=Agromyces bracchium TaxID=88376 RepID=A0A6I3M5B8_9MICO|nr:hypothetical protein [Agromyces bracchium]MTH69810.1 hypothetical protein [Agromyces bracchium]
MAGFWARRRRGAPELQAHDAELATRAGTALFAVDDRLRAASEELGFAEAALGSEAIAETAVVLAAARRQLGEAFRLNRRNHDPQPGPSDEVGARYLHVIDLCEAIERSLDDQTADLAERMSRARRAPDVIAGIRADLVRASARIAYVRATLDRLAARYARDALAGIDGGPAEADRLLGFAAHSLGVAERRRADGEVAHADVALEASARSVHRAATLLDAVETFEVEALRAEAALPGLAEECRRDLAVALGAPHSPDAAAAIAELQAALAALPATGVDTDPIGHLRRLRAARDALDVATGAVPATRAGLATATVTAGAPATRAASATATALATRAGAATAPAPATRAGPATATAPATWAATAPATATSPAPATATGRATGEPAPPSAFRAVHVLHAVRDADRRLDVARDAVAGHPGRIGAEALRRLAESERIRVDLGQVLGSAGSEVTVIVSDADHRAQVIEMARRAASLASESLSLARRDLGAMRAQGLGA